MQVTEIGVSTTQTSGPRKRILMLQTRLQPNGGADMVAAWMLQALVEDFDVTLLTWKDIDTAGLNRYYGTSLDKSRFKVRKMAAAFRWIPKLDPDPNSIQPHMLLLRIAKSIRRNYDLTVTGEMEYDFGAMVQGGPQMQYMHHPGFDHLPPDVRDASDLRGWPRMRALASGTLRPWMLLGDYSFDRMRVNCSLTNSAWTANWIEDVYGIRASVLYPPAPGDYRNTPWEQRENGVLCIGRLARAKRADWILQQLLPLRSRIQDLHFHIIGNRSLIKGDPEYFRRLTTLVAENKDWVTLHENISREQLAELASRQRYGIHAAKTEHFGIAVAEMVRAGCVPIVHNSGGQVEIVGNDPLLTFDDPQLAERLLYLTSHPDEVKELRSMLACQAELLTPESFMRGTRRVVKQLLASAGDESLLGAQCSVLHS
jgi:hypothetical protein